MKSNTLFLSIAFCLASFSLAFSQFSFNAGTGYVSAFGSNAPGGLFGFHLGAEVPRNNDVTFYGRVNHYLARRETTSGTSYATAIDLMTSPYNLLINYTSSTSLTSVEGGTRYYLGNGFDNGLSVYGGSNMAILFYGVKRNYDEFDQSLYVLPIDEDPKGTILSLSIGLQGGVKYTIPAVGTVYFDITGSYAILAQANNYTASESSFYSPLLFGFNLGFRKDLY